MSGFPTNPTNRAMQDNNTTFTCFAPNAATGANGALFDLGQINAFPIEEAIDIQVSIPAMPNNVNTGGNVTFTLVNNATSNTSNSANIATLAPIVVAGVATTGSAAVTLYFKLPGSTLEFIGLSSFGTANSGVNSAIVATAAILY